MKNKLFLTLLAAGFALTSCQNHHYYDKNNKLQKSSTSLSSKSQPVIKNQPATESDKISRIMQMKSDGLISEIEAMQMISVIVNGANKPMTPVKPVQPAVVKQVASAPAKTTNGLSLVNYSAKPQKFNLRSIGSDSMDRMMLMWEKEFQKFHPALTFSHEGKGSSTAIPALLEGKSNIGPMSRPLKTAEIAKFKGKFGYEPVQVRVAVDSLAVFIHPENPLVKAGITLQQLDAIFSAEMKRGGSNITTWGQLGLKGEWAKAPIKVYSRNSASGTYALFQKEVLMKGKYKSTNKNLVGSSEVVNAVAKDKFAIGYSGVAYKTPQVETLALSENVSSKYFKPNEVNAFSGDYPLTRSLFLTLNIKPGTNPSELQKEFIKYVYSQQGQAIVRKDGYFPVNAYIAAQEMKKLNR